MRVQVPQQLQVPQSEADVRLRHRPGRDSRPEPREVVSFMIVRISIRYKIFNPCLLFSCLSLSICLGTGQPEKQSKIKGANKIASFPKIKLVLQTTGTWLLYLLDLPLIPADHFFSRTKTQTIDCIDWLSKSFANAFQNSIIGDWDNKINKP